MAKELMSALQLEKLIDVHVFGKSVEGEPFLFEGQDYLGYIIDGNLHHLPMTPYSRDLNEAWKIVNQFGLWFGFQSKTQYKSMEVSMGNDLSDGQVVTFLLIVRDGIKQHTFSGEGSTLGRAICLSALREKGVEVQDDICETEL
jgi:hypothetical protein